MQRLTGKTATFIMSRDLTTVRKLSRSMVASVKHALSAVAGRNVPHICEHSEREKEERGENEMVSG